MSNISSAIKLSELKRDLAKKSNALHKLKERATGAKNTNLMENELDKAKLIIASQDVTEKLQKTAERLAEINAEEIMPLSDSMKAVFGPEIAHQFEHIAYESIQNSVEAVRAAKDAIDNAVLQIQGGQTSEEVSDMAKYEDPEPAQPKEESPSDTILGSEEESESPLGRDLKDSIDRNLLGMIALQETSFEELCGWMLKEAKQTMPHSVFVKFGSDLKEASKDKIKTSGWIFEKKLKEASKPDINKIRAKAIATVIESNLKEFGKSKTQEVINKFIGNNITEDAANEVLESFTELYGCNPAIFAAKVKKQMSEDTGDIASTLVKGINPGAAPSSTSTSSSTPSGYPSQPVTQQTNDKNLAVAKIASLVAGNQSVLKQPVSSITNQLSPTEKNAINSDIGTDPSVSVEDFLKNNQ